MSRAHYFLQRKLKPCGPRVHAWLPSGREEALDLIEHWKLQQHEKLKDLAAYVNTSWR